MSRALAVGYLLLCEHGGLLWLSELDALQFGPNRGPIGTKLLARYTAIGGLLYRYAPRGVSAAAVGCDLRQHGERNAELVSQPPSIAALGFDVLG